MAPWSALREGSTSAAQPVALSGSSSSKVPEDVQSLAYAQLKTLEASLKKSLAGKVKLDDYTRAHIQDTIERIRKTVESEVATARP